MRADARLAALTALERCRRDRAWSSMTVDRAIRDFALDRRDAALAARLCLGVGQNSTLCDYYIDCFCSSRLEPKLRDILRLGVYQLVFLDKIPVSAAVNESVSLAKKLGYGRAAGLVNAVMRRVAENRDALPEIDKTDIAKYLSIKYSHPVWMTKRIADVKGADFAEEFFSANNTEPPVCLQVNTLKVSTEEYCRTLTRLDLAFETVPWLDGAILLHGAGRITELPGFEEGLFYVQDAAAKAAAVIAGAEEGMEVLDACAAPGGKSFAAAIRMRDRGHILSCDIHEKKLALIRSGAERLGINIIEAAQADARVPDPSMKEKFDLVLADVPCSGLGVIRKKPEIRSKTEDETARLPELQLAIADNLASYVKPGGVLLYSTCTVLPEENGAVVDSFLHRHGDFTPEDFTLGTDIVSHSGQYSFWPNVDGTDGFFVCKLRRRK